MNHSQVDEIKRQAMFLARENKKGEPGITDVYWFPNDSEVRLIELDPGVPVSGCDELAPYYFRPSPDADLPAPSGIALIRPDEFGRLTLPEGWGEWSGAQRLDV